jgi:hypothetical protein
MTKLTIRSSAAMGPLEVTVYPPDGDLVEFALSSSKTVHSITATAGRYAIVARHPNGSRLRQSVAVSDKDETVELSDKVPATDNQIMAPEVFRGQITRGESPEPRSPATPPWHARLAGSAGHVLDTALVRAAGAELGQPVSLFGLLDERPEALPFEFGVDKLRKESGHQRFALCLWQLEGGLWKEVDSNAVRGMVKGTQLSEDFLKVSLNVHGAPASLGLIDANGFGPIVGVPAFADGVEVTFVAKGLLVRAADRASTPRREPSSGCACHPGPARGG